MLDEAAPLLFSNCKFHETLRLRLTFLENNCFVFSCLAGSPKLSCQPFIFRRAKCFEAAKALGLSSLREAPVADIEKQKDLMKQDEVMYRRYRHVVTEIDRTTKAAEALKAQDYATFGKLMIESHNSLR